MSTALLWKVSPCFDFGYLWVLLLFVTLFRSWYMFILYTGRFAMFSVITNIYNKKTKGPTLMKLFTATGELKFFFFLTTRYVRCVHHGWHGTHRYDIQVLATHASTWVHRYSSLLQWYVALGQRGHVLMVGRWFLRIRQKTGPTHSTSFSVVNGRSLDFCLQTQTPSLTKLFTERTNGLVCKRVLCVLCTKCTLHSNHRLTVWYSNTQNDLSPTAAIFSLHKLASPSGRNANYDEKQLTGGKKNKFESFLLFVNTVSCGFPRINFCNPGVHYETPCICLGTLG